MGTSLLSRTVDVITRDLPHAGATFGAVLAAHAGAGWGLVSLAGVGGAAAGLTLALAAEGARTVWARTLRRQRARNARAAERIRRAAARAAARPARTGLDVVDPADLDSGFGLSARALGDDLVDLDSGPFPPASTPAPTILGNGRVPAPLSRR
jgi:hypothetical protein